MQKLGLAYHEAFLKHDAGPDHPEVPERVEVIMNAIERSPWREMVEIVEAREAALDEVALVHDNYYVDAIRRLCEAGGEYLPSMESNIGLESYPAALRSVGAGLTLADGVMGGRWKIGFAPTRPPGHHATSDRPRGFCMFNSVAITAKYLQQKHDIERIAIVDFDVHHGNGTEEAFWKDPSVLYCSIHRANHYPYESGKAEDIGEGPGRGFTINVPLPARADDSALLQAFDNRIKSRIERFSPQILLVSAGFDGHIRDVIGGMCYTRAGYEGLADRILTLARKSAEGRIITLLEGGYDLNGLRDGVISYLGRLIEG
jgi:acetoin utilization deacetylase AcuC-like enzyme